LECAARGAAIKYECQTENSPNTADPMKREILDAVKRWCQYRWLAIENKLRRPRGSGDPDSVDSRFRGNDEAFRASRFFFLSSTTIRW